MRREIQVLRAIRHPNVIRLYGYSMPADPLKDADQLCLVYEYGRRGGLDKHYADADKAAQLTWPRRLSIASGIASALSYFHNSSATTGGTVFHRDVKSANVVLASDFTAKLIDCGLAKFIPADPAGAEAGHSVFTRTGMRFGTPGYQCMAYLESGDYDAKSEVYSLGVVLAELLTGRKTGQDRRFFNQNTKAALLAPDARAGQWPAELDDEWVRLVRQCLLPPEDRVDSMLAVLRVLREAERRHAPAAAAAAAAAAASTGGGDAAERELAALRQQLEAMRVQQVLSERERADAAARNRRVCASCGEAGSADQGIDCGNLAHWLCADCFRGFAKFQLEALETFHEHGCRLVCEHCLTDAGSSTDVPHTELTLDWQPQAARAR